MTFKVLESGWYRTRDGSDAEVVINHQGGEFKVVGYVLGTTHPQSWKINGYCLSDDQASVDLIEYLGKERPKQKKVARMAPALFRLESTRFGTSTWLYQSEERAREAQGDSFVRWLINTPYELTVEVPDNG